MQLLLVAKLLLLLSAANSAPVVAKNLLGDRFSEPLDGGWRLPDGRPVFGPSKTIRGVIAAAVVTSICAPLLGLSWSTGLAVGVAAMAGDLFSSFCKRRLALASSSMAPGLDQVPESLLPGVVCIFLLGLTISDVVLAVALFWVGEVVLSKLFFRLGLRDRPY